MSLSDKTGRGRDILDFEYAVKWNDNTMTYDYVGNKVQIEINENRKMILDAMKELKRTGKKEVRPNDIQKFYSETANSKKVKNISRTMQRMADDFEITRTPKYGYYTLIDMNELNHDNY